MDDPTVRPWAGLIQKVEPHFNEIAAKGGNLVTFKREAMFALQTINGSSYLQKCSPESIFNAIVNVASIGLTLSPAERLAYLVPRKLSRGDAAPLCCLDISYRGLVKIAIDSGGVAAVVAEIVRAGDDFEWFDKFTKPRHKFDPFATDGERGDVRGAYCMAILSSGIVQVEALSAQEINRIREKSKAENGPWFDWPGEMMKKTVVRRASKMWPHSERLQTAMTILDQHQGLDLEPVEAPQIEGPREKAVPQEPTPEADRPNAEDDGQHSQVGRDAERPPAPARQMAEKPPQPADGRPVTEGQIRIIRAKMKQAGLTDVDFVARWKRPIDDLLFAEFSAVTEWIASKVGQ